MGTLIGTLLNSEWIKSDAIGSASKLRRHIARRLVLDCAGWHSTKVLQVPKTSRSFRCRCIRPSSIRSSVSGTFSSTGSRRFACSTITRPQLGMSRAWNRLWPSGRTYRVARRIPMDHAAQALNSPEISARQVRDVQQCEGYCASPKKTSSAFALPPPAGCGGMHAHACILHALSPKSRYAAKYVPRSSR